MQAVLPRMSKPIYGLDSFIAYVQRFDFVSQSSGPSIRGPQADPVTGLHTLRRSSQSDGTNMGDVIPVTQFRAAIELIPRFGWRAEPRLTKETSHRYTNNFLINKYFDKDLFHCLHVPLT